MLVRDCMTVNPPTIDVTASCGEVVARMRRTNTSRLLVLRNGRLAGIFTRADLMRALFQPPDAMGSEAMPAFYKRSVGEVMTKHPIVTQPRVPVEQAARVLSEREIGALPVVDGADLVGMVTSRDVAGSLAHLLGADIKGVRLSVDLPDHLLDLRQLVYAMTPLKPALSPLVLAVRLDRLESRARLRTAASRPLLLAETLAMAGVRVAGLQVDPPPTAPPRL